MYIPSSKLTSTQTLPDRGWKTSFHHKLVIFRVYVNLPGGIMYRYQYHSFWDIAGKQIHIVFCFMKWQWNVVMPFKYLQTFFLGASLHLYKSNDCTNVFASLHYLNVIYWCHISKTSTWWKSVLSVFSKRIWLVVWNIFHHFSYIGNVIIINNY